MIDVKIGTKAKKSGTTGGSSQKTTYINGTISEADHASRADKAKKAETAEKAEYAVKAGNAQTANYAQKAGELDEDAMVLERYVRKDIDDTVHGQLTLEKMVKLAQGLSSAEVVELLKGFDIGRYGMDADGNLVVNDVTAHDMAAYDVTAHDVTSTSVNTDELLAKVNATIKKLKVSDDAAIGGNASINGDMTIGGTVSSPDFASGFLGGKGWRIANIPTTNAAGETEQKATAELDNLIVRGALRIYEMIVSQLLGENDNRIFSAMLEVDHYDPDSGKVYLDTQEGKMYNPFRKDDCIMVQQYSGMPTTDNQGYIAKSYELIVTEVGSEGEGENMLAWVEFRDFTSIMEDATPDDLIQKRDTFVRVDNITDPDRKGIIQMMTVGTDTPYIDIIHGMKTDPDNALKGRLGNLQGIIHPLFGSLQGFGEFLQNLYATGDFILRRTGESIDTKIQMMQRQFATRFAQTSYEASEEQNYLHNGQFLQATGSSDGELLIDGWQIEDGEDTAFWVDANGIPVMVNGEATTSGNHKVQIDDCEGRNVLHIISSGISQANRLIKQPGTHTEYDQPAADATETTAASREVQDTLYIMARVYANIASSLTIGFSGCTEVSGKTTDLQAQTITLDATGDWQTIQLEGKWNGTGSFLIKADGDLLIEQVTITDEPIDNLAKTVSTQILQTAQNIKLLGENISKVDGTVTQLGIDINANDKSIRQYVDEKNEKLNESLSSDIKQEAGKIELINKWQGETDTKISDINTDIDTITASVEEVKKTADGASASISKLEVTVEGISTTVGKAATTEDLMEAENRLTTAMDDQKRDFDLGLVDARDYSDSVGTGIRKDYATTITKVQQYSDSWIVAAGAFDKNGNLVQCAGETIDDHFASLFAKKVNVDKDGNITNISKSGLLVTADKTELESKITDVDGKVVEKATISTMISDGISNATIKANKIVLEGVVTANNYFKINTDGSMEAKAGKIGLLTINSDGSLVQDGMKIKSDGLLFYHAGVDAGYGPDNYYFKINTDKSYKPIAEILGCNCSNGAVRIATYRNGDYEYPCIPLVLSAGANYHPALKIEGGYIHNMRGDTFSFTSSVSMSESTYDSGSTIFLNNTSAINVYLPKDPMSGQYYRFIKNGSNVTFYGNGKNLAIKDRSDLLSSYTAGNNRTWIECMYDGEKWFINY